MIDARGKEAVEFFHDYTYREGAHDAFPAMMDFMSAQRFRTPHGLPPQHPARLAHPREEHLLPLMVVAGAAGEDRGRVAFNGTFAGVRLSAYHFG